MTFTLLLALVVGTWNGNWFPSGAGEYRAAPDRERARIEAAGRFLAGGLKSVDPEGTNGVVLILNEMRDESVVNRLLSSIGRKDLRIAAMTRYRLGDRADEQQDVIATTLPVVKSRWARWRYDPEANPPRGYAFASVVVAPTVTARVYAVHLKANGGGRDPAVATTNRLKRTRAIEQFLKIEKGTDPVILAGDFNADRWGEAFQEETLFTTLESAGFANPLALAPARRRRTHVSGAALDYVMTHGFGIEIPPLIVPAISLSDHYAVIVTLNDIAAESHGSSYGGEVRQAEDGTSN